MELEALVASVITLLTPYVAAGAKKAAEVAGETIAHEAGALLGKVRALFAGDQEAKSALESFEKNPNRYAGVLEDILRERAKADPEIAKELNRVLDQMGPRIEIFQKVKNLAGQVVGLDMAKWERGLAIARQEVDTVEQGGTLIGAKIREIP